MNRITMSLNLSEKEINSVISQGWELIFVTNVTKNSTMGGTDIQYIFEYETKETNNKEVVPEVVQEAPVSDKRYGPRNKGK